MNEPRVSTPSPDSALTDPFLWLEEIDGERSLEWVRAHNATTEAAFMDADFEADRQVIYDLATRPDSIPFIVRRGAHVYNFWQDAQHKRGIWRRTSLEEYGREYPDWEVILDLDALARDEGEDWVWRGCSTFEPEHRLGLVSLSYGGSDATVLREFDLEQKEFVDGGFFLPKGKGGAGWIDEDTLLVSSSLGGATTSGYARTVRRWKRDTPFDESEVLFEGELGDVSVGGAYWRERGVERTLLYRGINFEDSEKFLVDADGTPQKLEVPLDADVDLYQDYISVRLRSDWILPQRTFALDSLLVMRLSRFLAGKRDFEVLFEPAPRCTLKSFSWTRSRLLLGLLDNLESRVLVAQPQEGGWQIEPLSDVSATSSVGFGPLDSSRLELTDEFLLTVSDFLEPTTLYLVSAENEKRVLKSAPRAFDSSGLEVTRHEAVSVDGERIPYFQIAAKEPVGPCPTILYGYGGFEISLLPSYLGATGKVWSEWGGVYVMANIRGGGEFGASWHKAGMREGKSLAHEDFAAVARDLIARGVTTAPQLAARGGSNGGLLVGNMLTRFPELFGAIWCQVPLLDMKRYTQLLAGASWMSEYGDPDNADDWVFMKGFSAYHQVEEGRDYPPILLMTARHDDRVHPAHARKMAARLEALGHEVTFYEPDDGGGHGAANKEQAARLAALGYRFLKQRLTGG